MIIICSNKATSPVNVGNVCRENPLEEVFALPWINNENDLAKNLDVNRGLPCRMFPCTPDLREAAGDCLDFYPVLEDDAFGVMADALRHGRSVRNEIMRCPCPNGFYGRVITPIWQPGATVILRANVVQGMFPLEPISAKQYAMTTVPVSFRNTELFMQITGCQEDDVSVLAATDYIPGIAVFMQFHRLFSGKSHVFSVETTKFVGSKPILWRYNRAYKGD